MIRRIDRLNKYEWRVKNGEYETVDAAEHAEDKLEALRVVNNELLERVKILESIVRELSPIHF